MADQKLRLIITASASSATQEIKALSASLSKFGAATTNAGKSLTVGLTLPIIAGGAAMVKFAMQARETEQRFTVVTGKMGDDIRKWSEETADALSLNSYALRSSAADWFLYTKNLGLAEQDAKQMSEALTMLAVDMASFRDISLAEAQQKLLSGMSGEMEAVRRWGIDVSEAAVKTYAYENGIAALGQELTQTQKVQARYGIIMRDTAAAQGDWNRSLENGSPAVKLKALAERGTEVAVKFGELLLPVLNDLTDVASEWVSWLDQMSEGERKLAIGVAGFAAAIGPGLIAVGQMATGLSAIVTWSGRMRTAILTDTAVVETALDAQAAAGARAATSFKTAWTAAIAPIAIMATVMGVASKGAEKFFDWFIGKLREIVTQGEDVRMIYYWMSTAGDAAAKKQKLLGDTYDTTAGQAGALADAQAELNEATKEYTRSLEGQVVLLDSLEGRQRKQVELDIANQQAKLDLKDAQREYDEAVKKNGKNSDEAKRAYLRLRDAELRAKDALVDFKDAQDKLDSAKAQAEVDAITAAFLRMKRGAGEARRAAIDAMRSANMPVKPNVLMAEGGILPATPGGVPVIAAEAGIDEAFIPIKRSARSVAILKATAARMGYQLSSAVRMAGGGIISGGSNKPIYELEHLQNEASAAASAASSALQSARSNLVEAKAAVKAAKGAKELAAAKRELAAATRAYAKASADAARKAAAEASALLAVARAQRAQIVVDAEKALAENDQRLADQTRTLNERLAGDIDALWSRYSDAIASRADTIREAFGGLFGAAPKKKAEEYQAAVDEVAAAESSLAKMRASATTLEADYVAGQERLLKAQTALGAADRERSGQGMLERLREQAAALKEWSAGLGTLAAGGLSADVVARLRSQGPGNLEEIRSMMNLSPADLAEVSALWAEMGMTAATAATTELEPMRLDTLAEVSRLKTDAATELQGYVEEWRVAHEEIVSNAQTELAKLRFETAEAIKDIENLPARARASALATANGLGWDHQPGAAASPLMATPAPIDLKLVLDIGGAITEQVVRITSDMVRSGSVTARMGVVA